MSEERKGIEEFPALAKATLLMRIQRIRARMEVEELSGISAEDEAAFLAACRTYERKGRKHVLLIHNGNRKMKGEEIIRWEDWTDWDKFDVVSYVQ